MKVLFELFRRFDVWRIFGFIRGLGGACHVQKSSVTICVLPTPFRWRETEVDYIVQHRIGISIHALRVEGDGNAEDKRVAQLLISIHALRVEGDFGRVADTCGG